MGLLDDAIREHLDLKRRRGADPAEVERAEREALGPVRRSPEEPLTVEPEAEAGLAYDQEAEPGAYDQESGQAAYDHEADQVAYEQNGDHFPYDEEGEGDWVESYETEDDPFAGHAPRRDAAFDFGEPAPEEPHPEAHEPESLAGPSEAEVGGYEPPAATSRPESSMPAPEPPPPSPPPAPVEEWDEEDPFAEGESFVQEQGPAAPAPHPAHPAPPARDPDDHVGQETAEHDVEAEFDHERQKTSEEDVLEETPEFLQDTPDHDRLWFEQRPPRDFDFDG